MSYVDKTYERVVAQNPGEPEFHQAVKEVLDSLKLVIDANEEKYHREGIPERFTKPERIVSFRVPWVDGNGVVQVNKGYRIQFNSVIGLYRGGLRLHPSVDQSILKFPGFEQTLKNSLTGLPIGGGKGGSNFDPKGKSDREVMAFCQSFMTEPYRHIGKDTDIPAGDTGVGGREVGHPFGRYKRIVGSHEGVLTGKGPTFGGSLARIQVTGYGSVYILDEMLKHNGKDMADKTIVVSGSGNVAIYATGKAQQLGVKVVVLSDPNGYIYDKDGIQLDIAREIREVRRGRIKEYAGEVPTVVYTEGRGIWNIPRGIALPCATQNELNLEDARTLLANGRFAVAEGANMSSTKEATDLFVEKKILFMSGKAANAGGVATSGLERSQNALRMSWSFEEVDDKLHTIMVNILAKVSGAAERYQVAGNYVAGANIVGFERVAEAMLGQGIVQSALCRADGTYSARIGSHSRATSACLRDSWFFVNSWGGICQNSAPVL